MALAALPDARSLQVYLARPLRQEPGSPQGLRDSPRVAIRDEAAPILEQLAERHELPAAARAGAA